MRKYINADMRIQKILQEYDSHQPLEYLRVIANNYTAIHYGSRVYQVGSENFARGLNNNIFFL